MESLRKLGGQPDVFFTVFEDCFSEDGTDYILSNIGIWVNEKDSNLGTEEGLELSLQDVFFILREIRNNVAHEGIFWEDSFFAPEDSDSLVGPLAFDAIKIKQAYEKMLVKCQEKYGKGNKLPSFSDTYVRTKLEFDRFLHYFIEACLCYVRKYIET